MSVLTNPGREIDHFEHWLKSELTSDTAKLETFLKPYVAKLKAEGKEVLVDAAEAAVTAGEAAPGDGTAKMLVALTAFAAVCTKESLPYVESEARSLIEIALQNFKAKMAA